MATKRVILNGQTLIDLTLDTVTPEDVVQGKTFHGRDGEIYTGTYRPNIAALTITENGIYPIDSSVDGYGPITVEVTSGTVDPSQKAQLLPPVLSIDQATSTLTITDTRNDNHTEEYDIYFNGAYFMTVNQHIVKLNVYATIEDVVEVTATAKSQYFNTSIRSNTILWWKQTTSSSPSSSTTVSKLTKPTIFVNGIKKTLHIYDPNSTSFTKGYNVYRNDELIISTTTSANTVADRVFDLSEWIDYSEGEYFQAQIKHNPTYSTSYKDSDLSEKHYVHQANEGTPGLTYSRTADTIDPYYTCTGLGSATATEIIIPSYYNDEPVRVVGGFQSKTSITRVTLSPNVRTLSDNAFRYCSKLAVLDIPYTLNSIGYYALESTAITELDLSKNSISLGYYSLNTSYLNKLILGDRSYGWSYNDIFSSSAPIAEIYVNSIETWLKCSFYDYNTYLSRHPIRNNTTIYINGEPLTDLIVPSHMTSLPGGCFNNYKKLNSVDLQKVETVGSYAFYNSSVKAVFTSKKLTTISQYAFCSCSSLVNFDFQSGLQTIGEYAFQYCSMLQMHSLPNSVLTIGNYAFYNISALTEVTLPNSISSIGSQAFAGCANLEKINIPINVTVLNSTFASCTKLERVEIPWGVFSLAGTFSSCINLTEVVLTDNIHTIGDSTFYNCVKLQPFELPKQLVTIGINAFQKCNLWERIIVPDGVNTIGNYAFGSCESLKYCKIGKSVLSISNNIFEKSFSLEEIEVHPENIAFYSKDGVLYSIDNSKVVAYAFSKDQESLVLADGAQSIYSYVFEKAKLKEIYLPDTLTTISNYAFYQAADLKKVVFGQGLTTIGSSAFTSSGIEEVILPEKFKTLNSGAFSSCRSLAKVRLGSTITIIPSSAFYDCINLQDLVLPQSLITIESSAFQSCQALKYLEIPEKVETINGSAFLRAFYNEKGTIVFLNPSFKTVNTSAFAYCKLSNVVFPPVENFGNGVFSYSEIDSLDLSNLIFTSVPSQSFYSAKIKKIVLWKNITSIGSEAFRNATIEELTFLGKYPIITNNNYNQWHNCILTKINISDLEDWLTATTRQVNNYGSYGNSSVVIAAAQKNLIDENQQTVTTLEIPSTITSWQASATQGFRWIETLILPEHLSSINSTAFNDYYSLKDFYFNANVSASTSFSQNGFLNMGEWQEYGTTIHIGASVQGIPQYFISSADATRRHNITQIDFTEAVLCTKIGSYAFQYTFTIKELNLPDTITTLSSYCFQYMRGLETCSLPSNLTTIPSYAFRGCTKLKELSLPESCLTLNTYSFSYCDSLQSIVAPSITTIPNYCFEYCRSLKNFDFSKITTIGSYAFQHCYGLQDLTIPATLTSINSYAFYQCYGLLRVTLEGGAPSIGSQAFYYCQKLFEVVNYSTLAITKGNTNNGYIAAYAKKIITPEDTDSILINHNDFIFYNNGTSWYLMGYVGAEEQIILPENYEDENYLINNYCFVGSGIKNITIPNTITTLPDYFCYWCSFLETVEIPENITKIGYYAFQYTGRLNLLNYKAKAATSASHAFSCSGYLEDGIEINIENNVKILPGSMFGTSSGDYTKIKILNIKNPEGLTIKSGCFSTYCTNNLMEVYVPTIEDWFKIVFENGTSNPLNITGTKLCFGEDKILLENLEQINWDEITLIPDYSFYSYDFLTAAYIPEGVRAVGNSAFYNSKIQKLVIPSSVSQLGNNAFSQCQQLQEIEYGASTLENTSSSSNIFSLPSTSGVNLSIKLIIRTNVQKITDYLFYNMYYLTNIEFENSANGIKFGENAFSETTRISRVDIDRIENWLSFTFANKFSNPISQRNVTNTLYVNNEPLTILDIPGSITQINAYAFYGYFPLTKVIIPSSVTTIGRNALSFTPGLTTIVCADNHEHFTVEDEILYNKEKTQLVCAIKSVPQNITLPETLLTLDDGTFYQVTSLQTIQLPDSLVSIGEYGFYYCSELAEINLPLNLNFIGTYSFYYCQGLRKLYYNAKNIQHFSSGRNMVFCYTGYTYKDLIVYIGNQVESLPDYLFCPYGTENYQSQNGIKQVIFAEDSVCTTIGNYAFRYSTLLQEINLPASLTTISNYAFENCSVLAMVLIPINVTTIGSYAFQNCSVLQIFAEATSKPNGWNAYWNNSGRPVVWGYDGYEYTIQFVTNCDQVAEPITSLGLIQLPLLVQEEYGLLGWHTQEDFSDTGFAPLQQIHGSQIPHDENRVGTLYAKWVPISELDGTSLAKAIPIAENTVVTVTTIAGLKYYRFIPSQSKSYTYRSYDGSSHVDTWGNIMNSNGTQLIYNDDGAGNGQFTMSYTMTAGTAYYLGARLYGQGAGGVFTIKIY